MSSARKSLVALIVTLTMLIGTGVRAAEPIVILAPFSLSGPESVLDIPSHNGAVLAVEKLNRAGGLLGRPVTLVTLNTQGNTDPATNGLAALIAAHPKAVAGLGFSDSTDALAAGRVFQKAGLPFVTPGATAPDLPAKVGAFMFLAAYGDDAQARAMALYARDALKVRHVALWVDESRLYTRTIGTYFKEFFKQKGGSVDYFELGGTVTDFSSFISSFMAADPAPDAIYAAVMPQSGVPLIDQVRASGIAVPLLSGDGWDDAEITALSRSEGISDLYFTTHRFLGVRNSRMTDFITAYQRKFGESPPNAFAPLGFDTINLIAAAVKRAGSTDPEAVRAALAGIRDFDGLVGKISYSDGRRVPAKSVAVIELEDGREKPVWTAPPAP